MYSVIRGAMDQLATPSLHWALSVCPVTLSIVAVVGSICLVQRPPSGAHQPLPITGGW